jgi:hypothetical protein
MAAAHSQTEADAMYRCLAFFIFLICLTAGPSLGDEGNKLLGTWKLVSYEVEVQETGQKVPAMGEKPTGYATFSTEGRVFFVLTGEARKPATTDQERAELLNTLVAYSGTYSLEGETWTTNVEVAWNPEWVGTRQVRSFKVDGDRLAVLTPWRLMPNWADKGMTRSIITFVRSR